MQLDKFYSLRKDFILIGLTGRAGGGCSQIAKNLNNEDYIKSLKFVPNNHSINPEEIKFNLCYDYLSFEENWQPFKIIEYKNVLLLHLLFEAKNAGNFKEYLYKVFTYYGNKVTHHNRFSAEDKKFLDTFINSLEKEFTKNHLERFNDTKGVNLNKWLKEKSPNEFGLYFFDEFKELCTWAYEELEKYNRVYRSRFNHDTSSSLRKYGKCYGEENKSNINNIYHVAETINRIVKLWRTYNDGKSRVVIDALKNSLELMYFKEKYSGFYMVATNKDSTERTGYIEYKFKDDAISSKLINLDDAEYKSGDVNSGKFASPDIENCIQKSDYHIFHGDEFKLDRKDLEHRQKSLDYQLVRLISLIEQPGIVTPTALERTMQVAYNAKYNSGCISRQVGAVVTDQSFIVKSIGWNDVAKNQMPCKLRKLSDLVFDKREDIFSDYERNGKAKNSITKESISFKGKAKELYEKAETQNLNGRHCAFCFKTLQNSLEGEKNQVHTRSLHAEENAMMQIAKKGGNGLENGKLFTTASPCELCSKKAFQLGIREIYYIDPYPGIARDHTLQNGINSKEHNPDMIMFRGAVGRAYHKLYEPFMSYKDEVKILTSYAPKVETNVLDSEHVKALRDNKQLRKEVEEFINQKTK